MEHIFLNTDLTKTFIPEENAVKIFDQTLSKYFILQYLSWYSLLEDSKLNVPKVLKFFRTYEGNWAILQENIKGMFLEEVINTEPEEYDQFLNTLIDVQLCINEITIPGLGSLNDKLKQQISSLESIKPKREELLAVLDTMPKGDRLINGKLAFSNLVDSTGDLPYIIDWSEMTLGVPEAEAANTYLLLQCNSTEIAERYIKLYCARTKYSIETVRAWIPLMGASQLSLGVMSELHCELILPWLDL